MTKEELLSADLAIPLDEIEDISKCLADYSWEYLELKTIAQLQRDNPTMLVILENMA